MKSNFLSILFLLAFLIHGCGWTTQDTTNYPPSGDKYRLAGHQLTHDTLFPYEDILWGFDWLPDGKVIATEKSGKLLLIDNGSATELTNVPTVVDKGQGGLLDVSVHPDYATNGWIYLTYSDPEGEDEGAHTTLARAKLLGNALTDLEKLYVGTPNTTRGHHFGSRIAWKDGHVYFSIGDRGNRDVNPQDTTRDGGKIYRLNADGSVPTDNPFVGIAGAKEAIYSYGHRNPQGLVLNPATNEIWEHEHGPRGGDEINIIEAGKNYGWPVITYGINYNGTQITEAVAKDGMEQPLHYWVPSIAPSGMAFVNSDVYPGWKGDLMVGSLKFMYIKHVMLEGDEVVGEEKILANLGRVRDVRHGPDGHIYASVEGTGIVRLLPSE